MLSRIKSCHDLWRRESCCRRSLVVPRTRLTSTSALPKRRRRHHTSHHHPPIYMANIYKCEEGTIKHILWTCSYFGNLCELGMGFPDAPEPLAVYYKRLYFFIEYSMRCMRGTYIPDGYNGLARNAARGALSWVSWAPPAKHWWSNWIGVY